MWKAILPLIFSVVTPHIDKQLMSVKKVNGMNNRTQNVYTNKQIPNANTQFFWPLSFMLQLRSSFTFLHSFKSYFIFFRWRVCVCFLLLDDDVDDNGKNFKPQRQMKKKTTTERFSNYSISSLTFLICRLYAIWFRFLTFQKKANVVFFLPTLILHLKCVVYLFFFLLWFFAASIRFVMFFPLIMFGIFTDFQVGCVFFVS